jgi:hypothetical protein
VKNRDRVSAADELSAFEHEHTARNSPHTIGNLLRSSEGPRSTNPITKTSASDSIRARRWGVGLRSDDETRRVWTERATRPPIEETSNSAGSRRIRSRVRMDRCSDVTVAVMLAAASPSEGAR